MARYEGGPSAGPGEWVQAQGLLGGDRTIHDPATMDAFLTTAVPNGILTNYLGLLNQRFEEIGTPPPYALTKPSATYP